MARKHKRKKKEGVELNLAAMLDMAFQLLTFFILTFRQAPVEGQLSLNMPPPQPQTSIDSEKPVSGGTGNASTGLETLHLFVTSNEKGDAEDVRLEKAVIARGLADGSLKQIDAKLKSVFEGGTSFDRVQIAVDRNLRYDELMKLIDTCTKQKLSDGKLLQKISFIELTGNAGG